MKLPEFRKRQARLIDMNMKNALKSLSKSIIKNNECEYIFSEIKHPIFNSVLDTNSTITDIEPLVDHILSDYKDKSSSHCWWICENTEPDNLPDILIKKGYTKGPSFCGMHARIDQISLNKEIDPRKEIKRVETIKEIEEWVKPIQASFDFSDEVTFEFANCYKELLNDQRLFHFIAYYEGELAGSSTIFFDENSAGFYNGGVFPEFRRLGVITHLAQEMIAAVEKRGYKDLVIQAAEITQHLGMKIGFKQHINYVSYFSSY